MSSRRNEGDETWHRLLFWSRGQQPAERLAALVLSAEGYEEIDPQHPRGGPDGTKDVICKRNDKTYVCSVYFPSCQKGFPEIKRKLVSDLAGVEKNNANGFVVVTNQELSLSERQKISELAENTDLFHLERMASILNRPAFYGIRLEFLDIEMSKEEQLAFIAEKDVIVAQLIDRILELSKLTADISPAEVNYVTPQSLCRIRAILATQSD